MVSVTPMKKRVKKAGLKGWIESSPLPEQI
jgi:hypothetical protein